MDSKINLSEFFFNMFFNMLLAVGCGPVMTIL